MTDNRRVRLKQWFADKTLPTKEKSYLSQLMTGKASFGEKAARRLEQSYGMPHGYLDSATAEKPKTDQQLTSASKPTPSESHFYRVDVLDVQASAGNGSLVSTDFIETIRAIEYTNEQAIALFGNRPSESVKVITVRGDSMEGTIEPGDQIFLDMNVTEFDGDGIYVFVFGKTLHVKRLQMQKNRIAVLSDNKLYEPWYIEEGDEDQFRIMAKVLLRQSIEYKRFA